MSTITVRYRGICCFIDPTNGEGFKKRVVMPSGSSHNHSVIEHHLPIIEFLADDLKSTSPGMETIPYTRPGDDGQYERIELDQPVWIEFIGTKAGPIQSIPNLTDSVIGLDSLTDKKIELKDTLLGPAPKVDSRLASAVADLPAGWLMAGPPEAALTRFPRAVGFQERRIARWLEHIAEVDGDFGLKLHLLDDPDAVPQEIRFKSTTRLITIAHEPLRLIVGHMVPGEELEGRHADDETDDAHATPRQATGHFDMYWDLIAQPPMPRPLPEPFQGTGPGCAPANKP